MRTGNYKCWVAPPQSGGMGARANNVAPYDRPQPKEIPMNLLATPLAAAMCIALLAGGCRDEGARSSTTPEQRRELTQRQVHNLSRLEDAPTAVQLAFNQDHPDGWVDSVTVDSPPSGPLLYRIQFTRAGQPASVTYTREGQRFEANPRTDAPAPSAPRPR